MPVLRANDIEGILKPPHLRGHEEICEESQVSGAGHIGHEMSPVLKSCGERIGNLSGKLFSLEDGDARLQRHFIARQHIL